MVNTITYSSTPTPASTLSSTSAIEAPTLVLEVDHLMDVAATLMVGEAISPLVSTKRV